MERSNIAYLWRVEEAQRRRRERQHRERREEDASIVEIAPPDRVNRRLREFSKERAET